MAFDVSNIDAWHHMHMMIGAFGMSLAGDLAYVVLEHVHTLYSIRTERSHHYCYVAAAGAADSLVHLQKSACTAPAVCLIWAAAPTAGCIDRMSAAVGEQGGPIFGSSARRSWFSSRLDGPASNCCWHIVRWWWSRVCCMHVCCVCCLMITSGYCVCKCTAVMAAEALCLSVTSLLQCRLLCGSSVCRAVVVDTVYLIRLHLLHYCAAALVHLHVHMC